MSSTLDMETDCRHVAPNDSPFTARMRFHQSWFRRHILDLDPGPNPSARNELYGSQLLLEDGEGGANFITEEIAREVKTRLDAGTGSIEPTRLLTNMLSSQPMCFNLWVPLADDLELATRLVRRLPGLPTKLRVSNVALEYAPDKTNHLNDGTAFDAFVEYDLPGGKRGFVGIETKLTEPFTDREYAFEPRYSRWMKDPGWWWRNQAERNFPDKRFNQLWRNHLLAFAMLHQKESAYDEGYCAVLYHDEDASCADAIQAYRPHLRPEAADTLLEWPLSHVINAWDSEDMLETLTQKWLADFRLRYLDLKRSEAAWNAFRMEIGR